MIWKSFRCSHLMTDNEEDIPDSPGNYIVYLNKGSRLPDIGIGYTSQKMKSLEIIYTGVATESLRTRDYQNHFNGNDAGWSTLMKSIGAMFRYRQVPRDKNKPENGKTKLTDKDEEKLSEWMKENLTLFILKTITP